jgi:hypothetical protein
MEEEDKTNDLVPLEMIESRIYLIRGLKVMLDGDLARLYCVPTKRIKEQVNRNIKRFPPDFMFQLTWDELKRLRSQIATLKNISPQRGQHSKYLPYAFTEQGVAMLSSVLNSEKAVEVNIMIMRAFVKLRQVLAANKDLNYLFKELKHKVDQHDTEIGVIIRTIEKMISWEKKPKEKFGFNVEKGADNGRA